MNASAESRSTDSRGHRNTPPISRTSGSDYRVTSVQPPKPLDAFPQQLTIEDVVEPTS